YRGRADLREAAEGHLLRPVAAASVPDRTALQHGSAAAARAAAEDPAQHRRPGPSAVSGSGSVEHCPALPRTLDARAPQPAAATAQPAAAGRTGAASIADCPRHPGAPAALAAAGRATPIP